jgi:hypothetical protein
MGLRELIWRALVWIVHDLSRREFLDSVIRGRHRAARSRIFISVMV